MKNGYEKIDGLNDFYDKNTEILICGTIVGNSSKYGGFYYLGNHNSMYKFIDRARNTKLEELRKEKNIEQIKSVLKNEKIGFCDALSSCERKIGSSSDKDIDPQSGLVANINLLLAELQQMPNLKKIILNGCSKGGKNKVSTVREFNKIGVQQHFPNIKIETLISTSNRAFGSSKIDLWIKALSV